MRMSLIVSVVLSLLAMTAMAGETLPLTGTAARWLAQAALSAQGARTFRIGCNEWAGFAPLFLAKEKGYFGDLNVEVHFIATESEERAKLEAGRLDMIAETIDMFLSGRETDEFPGKIVFSIDESCGADGIGACSAIRSIEQLRGARVIAEPKVPPYLILVYLLHQKGMTLRDINLRHMTTAEAVRAFLEGRAEAVGAYEPYLSQALSKRKGAHLLASSNNLSGLIVDVAVTTEEVLRERFDDVVAVYRGWVRAIEDFKRDRAGAVAIMCKPFGMSPREFEKAIRRIRYFDWEMNNRYVGAGSRRGKIFRVFDLIGRALLANGLTHAVPAASEKICLDVIRAVEKPE